MIDGIIGLGEAARDSDIRTPRKEPATEAPRPSITVKPAPRNITLPRDIKTIINRPSVPRTITTTVKPVNSTPKTPTAPAPSQTPSSAPAYAQSGSDSGGGGGGSSTQEKEVIQDEPKAVTAGGNWVGIAIVLSIVAGMIYYGGTIPPNAKPA